MTSDNIRKYCKEALNIAEKHGIQGGLAFLIGEKLSLVFYQLKANHNKLKYLYPNSTLRSSQNPIPKGNKALQLSYTLAINDNYRDIFEQVDLFENVLKQFVEEIKGSFPPEDIKCYLNSYPRLAFKGDSFPDKTFPWNKSYPITTEDVFSEVEDILIINEIKNLFN